MKLRLVVVLTLAALVLRVTATVLSPFLILKFFLEFPRRSALVRRAPWLVPTCFAVSCVAWVFGMTFQSLMAYSFHACERFAGALDEEALTEAIMGEVGFFLGPVPPQDDMTLIVARIR